MYFICSNIQMSNLDKLTNRIGEILAVTQQAMERYFLHISLTIGKTKEWFRDKTKVTVIRRIAQLK